MLVQLLSIFFHSCFWGHGTPRLLSLAYEYRQAGCLTANYFLNSFNFKKIFFFFFHFARLKKCKTTQRPLALTKALNLYTILKLFQHLHSMPFFLFKYSNKKEYIHDVMLLIQATSVNSSFVYSVVPSSLLPPTHTQPYCWQQQFCTTCLQLKKSFIIFLFSFKFHVIHSNSYYATTLS